MFLTPIILNIFDFIFTFCQVYCIIIASSQEVWAGKLKKLHVEHAEGHMKRALEVPPIFLNLELWVPLNKRL